MSIRKQVYDLTVNDLLTSPVWEYALDEEDVEGQDEATVRPYPVSGPVDPSAGLLVVRAAFILADGSRASGYLTPDEAVDDLGTLQPVVVTVGGQVLFWCGIADPGPEYVAESYALLGRGPSEVFPVVFQSDVELLSGPVTGMIPGFLVIEDSRTGRTRTVR